MPIHTGIISPATTRHTHPPLGRTRSDGIEPEPSGARRRKRTSLRAKGARMITQLNHLLDSVETDMSSELDISAVARELATTEYHLRRMFSSLSGMVSVSPNRRPSPTILTRSTFLLERGLFCARLAPTPRRCRRHTLLRPRNGFRRIPGACAQARRSSRLLTALTTSPRPRSNSGSPSSAPEALPVQRPHVGH